MKLAGDFFYLIESYPASDGFVATLSLNPVHPIFQAHFPGQPITPGVVIIMMAVELLQIAQDLGISQTLENAAVLQLCGVRNAKFVRALCPTDTTTVRFSFSRIVRLPQCIQFQVSVTGRNEPEGEYVLYSKLSLQCSKGL